MRASIELACDDREARRILEEGLHARRLDPSTSVTLDVRIGTPEGFADDPRPIVRQPEVEIRAGPPAGDVRIEWLVEPAAAVIRAGALRAEVVLSRAAVEHLEAAKPTFLFIVLLFLLRRVGWHAAHAASAVDLTGRGWLIAGGARAGKSTTAALLASRQWAIGHDDTIFLASSGDRVTAIAPRGSLSLRKRAHDLLRPKQAEYDARRRKFVCRPEGFGAAWAPRVEPEILVFTTVDGATTHAEPLGPKETLSQLIRWSTWVMLEPDLAQEHLDLIAQLAR